MVFDILFSSARKSICGLCANFIAAFLFFFLLFLTDILTDRTQKSMHKNKESYLCDCIVSYTINVVKSLVKLNL